MPSRVKLPIWTQYGTIYDTATGYNAAAMGYSDSESSSLFWSKGHYGWQDLSKYSNVGGDFGVEIYRVSHGWIPVGRLTYSPTSTGGYYGLARIEANAISSISRLDGYAYGATAYNRMKPAKPEMSLINSVFELKDLPRQILNLKNIFQEKFVDLPSTWVAQQFGWNPFFADVVKVVTTQMGMEKRLKQLLRDNGKPVRRKIILADSSADPSSTTVTTGEAWGMLGCGCKVGTPRFTQTTRNIDRVWASAQFRYWLPSGPRDIVWTRKMKEALWGLSLTPGQIYQAIPWSWLVDWFTNCGDVYDNLSNGVAERLAADYFYVMRTSGKTITNECDFQAGWASAPQKFSGVAYSERLVKTRLVGDPFGFATSQNSLTGMQLSILGALGMSRVKQL